MRPDYYCRFVEIWRKLKTNCGNCSDIVWSIRSRRIGSFILDFIYSSDYFNGVIYIFIFFQIVWKRKRFAKKSLIFFAHFSNFRHHISLQKLYLRTWFCVYETYFPRYHQQTHLKSAGNSKWFSPQKAEISCWKSNVHSSPEIFGFRLDVLWFAAKMGIWELVFFFFLKQKFIWNL